VPMSESPAIYYG